MQTHQAGIIGQGAVMRDGRFHQNKKLRSNYKNVIIDTHSIIPAILQELEIIKEKDMIRRVLFVDGEDMKPRMKEEIERIELIKDHTLRFGIEKICTLIASFRVKVMMWHSRSPGHKRIIFSKSMFSCT